MYHGSQPHRLWRNKQLINTHGGERKRVKEKPHLACRLRARGRVSEGGPLTESSSWIIWTRLSNTGARFLTETDVTKAVHEHREHHADLTCKCKQRFCCILFICLLLVYWACWFCWLLLLVVYLGRVLKTGSSGSIDHVSVCSYESMSAADVAFCFIR